MNVVFEQLRSDLELAGYAVQTRAIYLRAARDLATFYGQSPATLGSTELRRWVDRLARSGISSQRRRQHHAALRFLYSRTLGLPNVTSFLSWPRDRERLTVVLSAAEVQRLLRALRSPTYRVFFTLLYATGLRLREACLLETRDIDAARGIIRVRHGKGGRERIVMLSPKLLRILRRYWSVARPPPPWLFASSRGTPVNGEVARQALKHAAVAAELSCQVTPRVLRHTFATHLLESGTDIRIIQALLGHRSIRTTARYARVAIDLVARVRSPFDRMGASPDSTPVGVTLR
ncbi:MAG TPA: tyrosine-type recombinase/integrase [Polyangiaceae bacterium]|nr:tyrosine-type recombinase/integrase [Polyangiaceae bacterium]